MSFVVFAGPKSTDLAWETAKYLNAEQGKIEKRRFPDGEMYLKLDSQVKGKESVVVSSLREDGDILELLFLLDLLKDSGSTQVHAVIPYLAYQRQDKRFTPNEALTLKTLLTLIHEVSDSITVVNAHFLDAAGEYNFHNIPLKNLDATSLIVEYFKNKIRKPIVISPDKGAVATAKYAAELLNCSFDSLSKKRISGEEVVIKPKNLTVEGHDVIILDDIISTGGTLLTSAQIIRGWKPNSINVGCVHGLFMKGVEPFQGVVERIVATNTVVNPLAKVSVAPLIASSLK
ncbi:Ribose-phosphate pyrophosphokinase [uncultured archaeon]|nr:Ribose-phosphate pyrophosphokinase [uncultured archaeon]